LTAFPTDLNGDVLHLERMRRIAFQRVLNFHTEDHASFALAVSFVIARHRTVRAVGDEELGQHEVPHSYAQTWTQGQNAPVGLSQRRRCDWSDGVW
jgi:hypothetical protein